jgi:peptide/nickel transport system ATP-binding protein
VYEGETLVGESGCGKSGNAILQLDKATSGQIVYQGYNETGSQGNKKIKKGNSDYFKILTVIKLRIR